jgi:hypothetical protein
MKFKNEATEAIYTYTGNEGIIINFPKGKFRKPVEDLTTEDVSALINAGDTRFTLKTAATEKTNSVKSVTDANRTEPVQDEKQSKIKVEKQ